MSAPSASPAGDGGLTRAGRMRPALAPESFALDARGMPERMAMARRFARLVAYTALDGQEEGDWSPFLASDPCFLLAEIALDADVFPARLEQLLQVLERLDGWYRELERQDAAQLTKAPNPVFVTLGRQIEGGLGPILRALCAGGTGPLEAPRCAAVLAALAPVWGLAGQAAGARHAGAAPTLAQVYALFAEAGRQVAAVARRALELSLAQDDHPPHAGLLLAFLQLFDVVRDELNRFTGHHLDYYYRDTLRMRARPAQPDEATVVLAPAPSCRAMEVPPGTRFGAGQDARGKTIVYASTHAAQVSQASLAMAATLRQERDADGVVRAVRGAPVDGSVSGWPAFGAATAPHAALGCVLAAPTLALAQGVRTVTILFGCAAGADACALAYYRAAGVFDLNIAFTLQLSGVGGWFTPAGGFTLDTTADPDQWKLNFTLAPGEPALAANPGLAPDLSSPWPMLRLCLDHRAPVYAYTYLAPVRLNSATITVDVTGLDMLQVATTSGPVAPGRPFPPFGNAPMPGQYVQVAHPELSLKPLTQVTLNVSWVNLPLFPPEPPTSEITPYSFALYYAGYPYPFADNAFTVAPSAYAEGAWAPTAPLPLFPHGADGPGAGASAFALDVDALRDWKYAGAVASLSQPATAVARATFRLTLHAPAYGFGSTIFPHLFAQQAIAAARARARADRDSDDDNGAGAGKAGVLARLRAWRRPAVRAASPAILPNPPFVPVAGALTVNYTAVESPLLAVCDGMPPQFFLLTPFGYVAGRLPAPVRESPGDQAAEQPSVPLFPSETADGHLYLGIAGAAPGQVLNLHVALRGRDDTVVALGQNEERPAQQAVEWRWLAANAWHDVPAPWIVSGTDDFGRSGIVSIRLPALPDVGNTALPAGLFWLEARVARDPDDYPDVLAILPNALAVRRDLDDGVAGGPFPLPAGSIVTLLTPLPGIKAVSQPYAGRDGAPAETETAFRTRVGERLRHKGRASHLRDYEQLVLEAAPEVWQVKCIGPNNSAGFLTPRVAPGDLVLAVAVDGSASPLAAAPLARAELLRIAGTVRALCSPAVGRIRVRNVAFESLCVTVDVRYVAGADTAACDAALNAALCELLSPAPPYPARLAIGCGAVQVDQVAALVRAQRYVAHAGPVTVLQRFLRASGDPGEAVWHEGHVVRSLAPWSVLVTAPRHVIGVLRDDGAGPAGPLSAAPAQAPAPVYTLCIAHPSAGPA